MSCPYRLIVLLALIQAHWAQAAAPVLEVDVAKVFEHDPAAFTQGLVFAGERLFESTGLYGRSELRELDPVDMRVIARRALAADRFGEGLAVAGSDLIQLTWRAGRAIRYRMDGLRPVHVYRYSGEGWGLAHARGRLFMSDGSDRITQRDPVSFRSLGSFRVGDDGRPVRRLNELEWVDGRLWANVWQRPLIAVIDIDNGKVVAWLNLKPLLDAQPTGADVANGIAWRAGSDRVLITGKLWSRLYEIALPSL